jgi:hypothetical protein
MKNNNKFIYYGILFYFLYIQIYSALASLLISPILIMRWNIHLIPLLLLLLIVLLSILFYRIKKFPKIRIWFILLVVFISTIVSFLNLPERFYLLDGNSLYSAKIQSSILDYILYCKVVNTVVFLSISYFKYVKTKRKAMGKTLTER